jgi:hypothetical protein
VAVGGKRAGTLDFRPVIGYSPRSDQESLTMQSSHALRWIPLATLAVLVGCPKRPTGPVAPLEGWHTLPETATFACYHPPDFGALDEVQRKLKRAEALDAMMTQWKGEREDGVKFEDGVVDEVETTLFGDMTNVEAASIKNLEFCKAAASGGGTDAWNSWINQLPGQLTAGECFNHFDYTMYDYLEIDTGWQRSMPICKDDKVRISGTSKDRFRLTDKGGWITVAGDDGDPSAGSELPCNIEGCYRGMLVLQFITDAGVETIYPIGTELIFTAPENGTLSYRINDDTFYDNTWFQGGGIIDHASVEISPAQ